MRKKKPISQREAHRAVKRVAELEKREQDRNNAWGSDYPGGVNIDHCDVRATEWKAVQVARKLGHTVVVVCAPDNKLMLFALKP